MGFNIVKNEFGTYQLDLCSEFRSMKIYPQMYLRYEFIPKFAEMFNTYNTLIKTLKLTNFTPIMPFYKSKEFIYDFVAKEFIEETNKTITTGIDKMTDINGEYAQEIVKKEEEFKRELSNIKCLKTTFDSIV